MFCTVCESTPSLAGRTDFICSGCLSFKRESLVLHYNLKNSRPSVGSPNPGNIIHRMSMAFDFADCENE